MQETLASRSSSPRASSSATGGRGVDIPEPLEVRVVAVVVVAVAGDCGAVFVLLCVAVVLVDHKNISRPECILVRLE